MQRSLRMVYCRIKTRKMANCCWRLMLWSDATTKTWWIMLIKSISIEFVEAQQVRLEVNAILGDVMGFAGQEEYRAVMTRLGSQWGRPSDWLTSVTPAQYKQNGFKIKNEIEGQCQSSPKLTGVLTVLRRISGPNWETLNSNRWKLITWTGSNLGKI